MFIVEPKPEIFALDRVEEFGYLDSLCPTRFDAACVANEKSRRRIVLIDFDDLERRGPVTDTEETETSFICHTLLSRLTVDERRVTEALWLEEMTTGEVAKKMGIKKKQVFWLMQSAFAKMRSQSPIVEVKKKEEKYLQFPIKKGPQQVH